ncbi:MAG: cytochrome b [Steroidobacteraceae bacterium]
MTTQDAEFQRYTKVAIILHWLIAVFIITNLVTGMTMLRPNEVPPYIFQLVALHVSSGITVLVLTVVRIAWRLTHRPPPFISTMKTWERKLAHFVHGFIYFLMAAVPLMAWTFISAFNPPNGKPLDEFVLWGVVRLPFIAPIRGMDDRVAQDAIHDFFKPAHAFSAYLLLALLVLHIAGPLKHQFFDKEKQLQRMGIGRVD